MKRLEIIANRTVEEDFFDAFEELGIAGNYTLIPSVQGAGRTGKSLATLYGPMRILSSSSTVKRKKH